MPLSSNKAAALDTAIQSAVSNIPNFIDEWDRRDVKREQEIASVDDFIYGYTLGYIANAFLNIIILSEGRFPTSQEKEEAKDVIYKRTSEIRHAISLKRYRVR